MSSKPEDEPKVLVNNVKEILLRLGIPPIRRLHVHPLGSRRLQSNVDKNKIDINSVREKMHQRATIHLAKVLIALKKEGKNKVLLNELWGYKRPYFNWYLHFLINKNIIKAFYLGPSKKILNKQLKESKKRRVKSFYNDPWERNRHESARTKIWCFYTTGHKDLRERRLKAWARYIELDFDYLLKLITNG